MEATDRFNLNVSIFSFMLYIFPNQISCKYWPTLWFFTLAAHWSLKKYECLGPPLLLRKCHRAAKHINHWFIFCDTFVIPFSRFIWLWGRDLTLYFQNILPFVLKPFDKQSILFYLIWNTVFLPHCVFRGIWVLFCAFCSVQFIPVTVPNSITGMNPHLSLF